MSLLVLGDNLSEHHLEVLTTQSTFSGASTVGIGDPGKTQILRFNEDGIKKHIKNWMKGQKDKNSFQGIENLETATRNRLLHVGQLLFGTVSIKHHQQAEGTFRGWIYDSFSSFLTFLSKKQKRTFAYLHAAVYVGEYMGVFYVVENGGFSDPDTGIGHIEPVLFNEAFECDAHFFVVSPQKDDAGKSTRSPCNVLLLALELSTNIT